MCHTQGINNNYLPRGGLRRNVMSVELNIVGMTCGHCQISVTRALKGVAGVTDARVQLATGRATVHGAVDLQQLVQAVENEG